MGEERSNENIFKRCRKSRKGSQYFMQLFVARGILTVYIMSLLTHMHTQKQRINIPIPQELILKKAA